MNVRNVTGYGGLGFRRSRWIAMIVVTAALCWLAADVASARTATGAPQIAPTTGFGSPAAPAPAHPLW